MDTQDALRQHGETLWKLGEQRGLIARPSSGFWAYDAQTGTDLFLWRHANGSLCIENESGGQSYWVGPSGHGRKKWDEHEHAEGNSLTSVFYREDRVPMEAIRLVETALPFPQLDSLHGLWQNGRLEGIYQTARPEFEGKDVYACQNFVLQGCTLPNLYTGKGGFIDLAQWWKWVDEEVITLLNPRIIACDNPVWWKERKGGGNPAILIQESWTRIKGFALFTFSGQPDSRTVEEMESGTDIRRRIKNLEQNRLSA